MKKRYRDLNGIILNWRIHRLNERCEGLKAKIAYWQNLGSTDKGGLPIYYHEKIGEWKRKLAVLQIRKERLVFDK